MPLMKRRVCQGLLVSAMLLGVVLTGCAQAAKTRSLANGKPFTRIDLTKWKLRLEGAPIQSGFPAYFPLDDGDVSAAVIQVATEAEAPEDVAYLALVEHKQDPPTAFVGGAINGPAGSLISVSIELSNSDLKPATFFVGDVALLSTAGQRLRFVGVSRDDSPLIAKFSDKAESGSEGAAVTVDAGKTVRLNYCVAVTPSSFPLRLRFGTANTDIVLKDPQSLVARKVADAEYSVSLAGAMRIGEDMPSQNFEASVGQRGAVLRFESIPLKKGDQLAASGSRSIDTLDDALRFSAGHAVPPTPGPEVPLLEISRGHGYLAGRLFVLQPIAPIQTAITVQGNEVRFADTFQAKAGDILGATVSDLDGDGQSVLSQYAVTPKTDGNR